MINTYKPVAYITFILSFFFAINVQAKSDPPPELIGHAFLPFVNFSSDYGLGGGVTLNQYHFSGDGRPFEVLSDLRLSASTNGYFSSHIALENNSSIISDLTSRFEIKAERVLNELYFPQGNNSTFNQTLWSEGYYHYDALGFDINYEGRYELLPDNPNRDLDILVLGGGISLQEYSNNENNILADNAPLGIEGGWYFFGGIGLTHDTRDNQYDPRSGGVSRIEFKSSSEFLGDYQLYQISFQSRLFYTPPFSDNLTFARKMHIGVSSGDTPFWLLPEFGGEFSARGLPARRLRDNGVYYSNLELRKWLFHFESNQFRIGLTAFTDAGRVFSEFPTFSEFREDGHRTFGGGPVFSIFSEDFIVRTQFGHSDEMSRVYLNVGYSF